MKSIMERSRNDTNGQESRNKQCRPNTHGFLTSLLPLLMVLLCSCTIKYKDVEVGIMQMQVREGSASVYSNKIYGVDIGLPLASAGTMKLTLGYMSRTEGLIPTKEDGELPNVLIDLSTTHNSNTNDLSDTYATGEVAEQIYYPECEEELPPTKEEKSPGIIENFKNLIR